MRHASSTILCLFAVCGSAVVQLCSCSLFASPAILLGWCLFASSAILCLSAASPPVVYASPFLLDLSDEAGSFWRCAKYLEYVLFFLLWQWFLLAWSLEFCSLLLVVFSLHSLPSFVSWCNGSLALSLIKLSCFVFCSTWSLLSGLLCFVQLEYCLSSFFFSLLVLFYPIILVYITVVSFCSLSLHSVLRRICWTSWAVEQSKMQISLNIIKEISELLSSLENEENKLIFFEYFVDFWKSLSL